MPAAMARAHGRNTFQRGGNLDHQVRPIHPLPELFGLGQRPGGIMCQRRADFQRNVAIRAFALAVHGRELVAGIPDVFDGKLPEDLLGIPAGPGQWDERRFVVVRLGDGVEENGWIGGDAADIAACDHGSQLAILEQAALDVIVPEGLTQGIEFLNCHVTTC